MSNEMNEAPDFGQTAVVTREQSNLATPASLPMSEVQLQIARERPRDEMMVGDRLIRELKAHPEFASEGFYSIPRKDRRKGVLNFVEGLSIRAAEHIWSRWGNCTVADRVADERHDKIMVQGLAFDYESGALILSDLEVGKMGKSRNGSYPLNEDALRLAVGSGKSKVKRNAFLSLVPVWVKERYESESKRLTLTLSKNSDKPYKDRISDAKSYFTKSYRLKEGEIDNLIFKINEAYPGIDDETLLRYLLGIKNSLKFGDVESEFVFGEEKQEVQMPREKQKTEESAQI